MKPNNDKVMVNNNTEAIVQQIQDLQSRICIQSNFTNEVEKINNTIDFVFSRDNLIVDNMSFSIMNITPYKELLQQA